jgi:hypothetical protein
MKIATTTYIDIPDDQISVSRLERSIITGRLEAYGYYAPLDQTFRVGYEDDSGRWQAEDTAQRISPPAPIMQQISSLIRRSMLDSLLDGKA